MELMRYCAARVSVCKWYSVPSGFLALPPFQCPLCQTSSLHPRFSCCLLIPSRDPQCLICYPIRRYSGDEELSSTNSSSLCYLNL